MDFGNLIGSAITLMHTHLQGALIGTVILSLLFYFKPVVAKRAIAIILILGVAYCVFAVIGESTLSGMNSKNSLVNMRP